VVQQETDAEQPGQAATRRRRGDPANGIQGEIVVGVQEASLG
jgi:hypothetical protein